jgi:hypothetical protein
MENSGKENIGSAPEKLESVQTDWWYDEGSFRAAIAKWEEEMSHVFEANRAAERLTAEDYAVRINV